MNKYKSLIEKKSQNNFLELCMNIKLPTYACRLSYIILYFFKNET